MNNTNDMNSFIKRDAMVRVEGVLELWEPIDAVEYVSPFDRRCSRMVWRPYFCVLLPQERTLVHYSIRHGGHQAPSRQAPGALYQSLMGVGGNGRPSGAPSALNKIDEVRSPAFTESAENLYDGGYEAKPSSPKQLAPSMSPASRRRRGSVPSRSDAYKNDHTNSADTAKKSSKKTSEKVDGSMDNIADYGGEPTMKRSSSLGRLRRSLRRFSFASSSKHQAPPAADTNGGEGDGNALHQPVSCGQLKAWFSHESLLSSQQQATIVSRLTLPAGQTAIRDLHLSVLQRQHCFELTTPDGGSRCYCTNGVDSHREWMNNLSLTIDADQATKNRVENSLTLSVAEAKNVASKKKCFCEVYIDDSPAARTTAKQNDGMLFWGEVFELKSLPSTKTITIKLYELPDSKKKKEGKQLVGTAEIATSELTRSNPVEKWYTLNSSSANRKASGEAVQLRVKARYQSVPILPVTMYQELVDFIEVQYKQLVESLEPVLSTKIKEDVSDSLVRVMIGLGHDVDFLTDITMAEVSKIENIHLTFRGNSLATKAVEAHLKILAERYVKQTLGDVIHSLIDNSGDCEVDPGRLTGKTSLTDNQTRLSEACQTAWHSIFYSTRAFPTKLKVLFSRLRHCCTQMQYTDVSDHLISACVFLRLICPAILAPNLFRLTQDFPTAKAARTLTLVAKTIQTLANFSEFGHKENYMTFMNSFIESESANMKKFLRLISDEYNQSGKDTSHETPQIDIGLELSVLHAKLSDVLSKVDDKPDTEMSSPIPQLRQILANIDSYSTNPELFRPKTTTPLQAPPIISRSRPDEGDAVSAAANEQLARSRARRQSRPDSWNMSVLMNDMASHATATGAALQRNGNGGSWQRLPQQSASQSHQQQASQYKQPPPPQLDEMTLEESWRRMVSVADSAGSGQVTLVPFVDDGSVRKLDSSRSQYTPVGSLHSSVLAGDSSAVSLSSATSQNSSSDYSSESRRPLAFVNPALDKTALLNATSRAKSSEHLSTRSADCTPSVGMPPQSPNWSRTMPVVAARTQRNSQQRLGQRTEPPPVITHPRLSTALARSEPRMTEALGLVPKLSQAAPPTDGLVSVMLPAPILNELPVNGNNSSEHDSKMYNMVPPPHFTPTISLLQLHDELARKSAALRVAERRDCWPTATLASTEAEFV